KQELAPSRSAQNLWLPDFNKDGSHDWRDLTVLTDRVVRLTDRAKSGVADEARVLYDGFNADPISDDAGGIVVHDGDVFVATAPDVWRMRDTKKVGTLDAMTSISHGYSTNPAFSGHGLAG